MVREKSIKTQNTFVPVQMSLRNILKQSLLRYYHRKYKSMKKWRKNFDTTHKIAQIDAQTTMIVEQFLEIQVTKAK